MLHTQSAIGVAFPLYATQCPDGWVKSSTGCRIPTTDHPNYPKYPLQMRDPVYNGQNLLYNTDLTSGYAGKELSFNSTISICDKKQWTKNCGISWDGVSNYNQC